MEVKKIRTLKADEIECRIGTISEKGCSLLLYKDARVDMRMLDEVFGSMNWKRQHEVVNGNLYCTVSIWDDDKKEWISKQDVGTESNTEAVKGETSDAFKRACFNWGIGRELYTAPFIWIKPNQGEFYMSSRGKYQTNTKFRVKEIGYKGAEINRLVIVDDKGQVRYTMGGKVSQEPAPQPVQQPATMPSGMYTGAQLQQAIESMRECKSAKEVGNVWNAYKNMQSNPEFEAVCKEMCKKFKKS